jgi:hypothetical protein
LVQNLGRAALLTSRKQNLYVSGDAQVAELVDALASGASGCKVVKVRVLSWAPSTSKNLSLQEVTPYQ